MLTGVGNIIIPRLKFSYDHLSSETHKACFLFCSLFLKNQIIRKGELVDLWFGEGLLDDSDDITVLRCQSICVIQDLKNFCLLEEVETYFGNFVKMHVMLRDLALRIASQEAYKILAMKPEGDDMLIIEEESARWNTAVIVEFFCYILL